MPRLRRPRSKADGLRFQLSFSIPPSRLTSCEVVLRLFLVQPGVTRGVLAGVVRIEIDEATLDLPIADFEDVAPAAREMLGRIGAPWPVLMFAVARALRDNQVLAREDPIEVREVMDDRFDRSADVAEQFADLVRPPRDA